MSKVKENEKNYSQKMVSDLRDEKCEGYNSEIYLKENVRTIQKVPKKLLVCILKIDSESGPVKSVGYSRYETFLNVHCVDIEGKSVCLTVLGYEPYILLELPISGSFLETNICLSLVKDSLTKFIDYGEKWGIVKRVEFIEGLNMSSVSIKPKKIAKIYLKSKYGRYKALQKLNDEPLIEDIFKTQRDGGMNLFSSYEKGWKGKRVKLYQSFVSYEDSFLIDLGLVSCSWIVATNLNHVNIESLGRDNFKNGSFSKKTGSGKRTTSSLEAEISFRDIRVSKPEDFCSNEINSSSLCRARIMSFDLECLGRNGKFPQSEEDPIIQIGIILKEITGKMLDRVLFSLGNCGEIKDSRTKCFGSERDMILGFIEYVMMMDPDIFTGYNIDTFDFIYVLDRAKNLGIRSIFLSKRLDVATKARAFDFKAGKRSRTKRVNYNLFGRIDFDLFPWMLRNHRLERYSLEFVSQKFLGDGKLGVPYSEIPKIFFTQDKDKVSEIGEYCVKDCDLPLRLLDKLKYYYEIFAFARLTGVDIERIVRNGESIRVINTMLRECKKFKYFIPTHNKNKYFKIEGGKVLDPIEGFYKYLVVLDFQSLYPSIMKWMNMCTTTKISTASDLDEVYKEAEMKGIAKCDAIIETMNGVKFISKKVRSGIITNFLIKLLSARFEIKKEMKSVKGVQYDILNSRQKSLKIICNSVYGFLCDEKSKLLDCQISGAVTYIGRKLIVKSKEIVETSTVYPNIKIGYGDTDSVMLILEEKNYNDDTLQKVFKISSHFADLITEFTDGNIIMELEKFFGPCLLFDVKKSYSGILWVPDEKNKSFKEKGLYMAGIEAKKLSYSPFTRNSLQAVLYSIFKKSKKTLVKETTKIFADLNSGKVPVELLTKTAKISKLPADYNTNNGTVTLMKDFKRRTGKYPIIGEKIDFVYVHKPGTKKKSECVRDPKFLNGVSINYNCYAEEFKRPLKKYLKLLKIDVEKISKPKKIYVKIPENSPMRRMFQKIRTKNVKSPPLTKTIVKREKNMIKKKPRKKKLKKNKKNKKISDWFR